MHMSIGEIPVGASGTKAVYIIKMNESPVPACHTPAEARAVISSHLEWGVLNGHSLQLLERVISMLYLPLLSSQAEDVAEPNGTKSGSPLTPSPTSADGPTLTPDANATLPSTAPGPALTEEFLVGLRKFASHLRRTIQQVEGDVKLKMPTAPAATLSNTDKCAADPELLKQVRHAIMWGMASLYARHLSTMQAVIFHPLPPSLPLPPPHPLSICFVYICVCFPFFFLPFFPN